MTILCSLMSCRMINRICFQNILQKLGTLLEISLSRLDADYLRGSGRYPSREGGAGYPIFDVTMLYMIRLQAWQSLQGYGLSLSLFHLG